MQKRLLSRKKSRNLFEENIYFSTEQVLELLGISRSSLSRQLKSVLKIPGCEFEMFKRRYCFNYRPKYQRIKLKHYNLNTVVAIAYRINNKKCRVFLEAYHAVMTGLRVRLVGPNYYAPSILEWHEFVYNAKLYSPPLKLDSLE